MELKLIKVLEEKDNDNAKQNQKVGNSKNQRSKVEKNQERPREEMGNGEVVVQPKQVRSSRSGMMRMSIRREKGERQKKGNTVAFVRLW